MKGKIVYLLIGQKGSGKSFVGTLFEKEFGIKFIRVEDWAKEIKRDRDIDNEAYLKQVFEVIEHGLRDSLKQVDQIVFESTGLTDYFDQMLQRLKKDYQVTTIRIQADRNTCIERVRNRDQTIHINLSDDQVSMINEKVLEKNLSTDFQIDNEGIDKSQLIDQIRAILELRKSVM